MRYPKKHFKGEVTLEGSKSILNRVILISTLLKDKITIKNNSSCGDIKTLSENLLKLGCKFKREKELIEITPLQKIKDAELYVQDSGTAFRFLLAFCANSTGNNFAIDVSKQLKKRKSGELIKLLRKMGAQIENDKFPLLIKGRKLKGGVYKVRADISSQFISSVLLIAPYLNENLTIKLEGKVVSKSYLKMTLAIMQKFGVKSTFNKNIIIIFNDYEYQNPGFYEVEPDFSAACYFLALGALSEKYVCVNFPFTKSIQGDYGFIKILAKFGAEIKKTENQICIKKQLLKGITVDMNSLPDQVPTLAILALFGEKKTEIKNISQLQYKETNRILALTEELKKLDAAVSYNNDKLIIHPLKNKPPHIVLKTYNDHRMAMSFALIKAIYPYLKIDNYKCVKKSCPKFWQDYQRITKIEI